MVVPSSDADVDGVAGFSLHEAVLNLGVALAFNDVNYRFVGVAVLVGDQAAEGHAHGHGGQIHEEDGVLALGRKPVVGTGLLHVRVVQLFGYPDFGPGVGAVKISGLKFVFGYGLNNYVLLHLPHERIATYQTLRELADTLPQPLFMRVHKSYIVSLDHVRLLDGNTLYVQDKLIPVSDTYREALYRVVRGN